MSWTMYESFENGDYIHEENIKLVTDFICANLNNWSPNRSYYQAQHNYATKLYHVCKWRKQRGFRPIENKGEAICNNELVNFFADEKHKIAFAQQFETFLCVALFYEIYDNFLMGNN